MYCNNSLLSDSWNEFLLRVQKNCSSLAFKNWMASIQFKSSTEEEVVLSVPNIFVQKYLLENYEKELASFFPRRSNGEIAVQFVIDSSKTECSDSSFLRAQKSKLLKKSSAIHMSAHHIQQRYTFDSFIEGGSNLFAKSVAMGVASYPGKKYNPLFIWGGVGLGKTHLLHSIANSVRRTKKSASIQCITTETFVNHLVKSLREKSIDKMKRFYRSLDLLLIDDVQFLQNRPQFEEELSFTLESLVHQKKQIVITSDIAPENLLLSKRLVARMEWGLVTSIGEPELETRVAILHDKAKRQGFSLDSELAFFIAERVKCSVRALEGVVNKISASSYLLKRAIDIDLIRNILPEKYKKVEEVQQVTMEHIFQAVEEAFSIDRKMLQQGGRKKSCVLPRQVAMFLAKKCCVDSLSSIGAQFGKTHSTVVHASQRVQEEVKKSPSFRKKIQQLEESLYASVREGERV